MSDTEEVRTSVPSAVDKTLSLKRARGMIKRQLTSSEAVLASIEINTDFHVLNLDQRLEKHLKLWDEFESIQTQLESDIVDEDQLANPDPERIAFENRYHKIAGLFKKYIRSPCLPYQSTASQVSLTSGESNLRNSSHFNQNAQSPSVQYPSTSATGLNEINQNQSEASQFTHPITTDLFSDNQGQSNRISINETIHDQGLSNLHARFELPKLHAPIFHGGFDTWLTFHDSFKSMCHDNPNISPIQKFHYLKACLKDEAAEVIASLEISSTNYQVAWDLLTTRYDNRKVIVNSHIKALFEIPSVSKDFPIRTLLDHVQKRIRALRALGQPVDQWDTLLVFIIREKLNNYTREKWEESTGSTELPSLKDIITFLERRSLIENTQPFQKSKEIQHNQNSKRFNLQSRPHFRTSQTCLTNSHDFNSGKPQPSCVVCKGVHQLHACDQFHNLTPQERYDVVKKLSICHNCLLSNHRTIECRRGPCRKCHKRHNTLLHFNQEKSDKSSEKSVTPSTSEGVINQCITNLGTSQSRFQSQVVLGTVIVDVLDKKGQYRSCRALLDSCSQCNSITEKLANSLGLVKKETNIKLKGVENIQSRIKYITSTTIKSRYEKIELQLAFLVFQEISESMPAISIDKKSIRIPDNIFLADPSFNETSDIDMLIGAEHFYSLMRVGQIRVKGQSAVFQETDFGWIFSGRYVSPQGPKTASAPENQASCNLIKFHELPILWELGEETSSKPRSEEEQAAESHYANTTRRNNTGRYVIKLPFNTKKESLGDSRNTAFQRFYALEKRFAKNVDLQSQYSDCIQNYFKEGHISSLEGQDISRPGYYLPHQAVIKSDSLTTKTRVVFDGSAKTSTGVSLNETLLVGPTIQEDLFSIVTRFRSFPIAITADIEQMYRQIRVAREDSLYQRILWRDDPSEPIKVYALNTVTFGTSCAPFLATRTLHKLADDEQVSFPVASAILRRDFYVDDLLTGAQSLQEARQLRDDLFNLLQRGGFNLRKWVSNRSELCHDFLNKSSDAYLTLDPSETVKALGIHWDPITDSILYTVNLTNSTIENTKRKILAQCAKLFDPLGLLGPVILVGKILIQQFWKLTLGWDDPITSELQDAWINYKSQLPLLNGVRYPRCITLEQSEEVQLHGFSDASEKAYGACLFLRSTDSQGTHHCALINSKSRVAPLKTKSLPKLELCAATILIQLYKATSRSLQIKFSKTIFWSDSTIVLNWINSQPHTLPTFEANRVAEIQSVTDHLHWRHVRTHDNPADFISRGQLPQDFLNNTLWRNGPQWLSKDEAYWPQFNFMSQENPLTNPVQFKISLKIAQQESPFIVTTQENSSVQSDQFNASLKITLEDLPFWTKYSSFKMLQVVVAYCLRFIRNAKNKDKSARLQGPLSRDELNLAHDRIIQKIQAGAFRKDLKALSMKNNLDQGSILLGLNPFLDQGIIRVGGRLNQANLTESQKHPIVLPQDNKITRNIIRDQHVDRLHAGVQATLYGVREKYWPLNGRATTRNVIRQCVKCFRAKPRGIEYPMGDLPQKRTSFTRPFSNVGVDYCGPFYTKEHRRRNRTKIKTYVSIFVCFATKAVHLELADDLSAKAFLACLKRFIARRGLPYSMHSDNGNNFVGASNELKELYKKLKIIEQSEEVSQYLSKREVAWRFIPPRAPHFGGLWEAGVKSFKHHFTRIAGNSLLTYEQLHTYVVEVEAILNSRPLTPLSSDPNDLLPLTPGHFLTGSSMTGLPEDDLRSTSASRLSCWQIAQQMRQHFWERWHKEYLNEQISRKKWRSNTDQEKIHVGRLVVVKEDNLPPMKWSLARIIEMHPGRDGVTRVATIRTATSTCKRGLRYLCPLPIE